MVQCFLCQEECAKDIYVRKKDKVYCLRCDDVAGFLDCESLQSKKRVVSAPITIPATKKQPSPRPQLMASSSIIVRCPKCKIIFSDKHCKCGFKSPLIR